MNELHGGDVTGYRLQYGRDPLDFSASLNPLGMPQAVRRAAMAAVDDSFPYPDPYARELTAALAVKLGVKPENIILGNGSADLIYRYAQAIRPRRALLPVPSFAEYERALQSVACDIQFHVLQAKNAFDLDESILPEITQAVDALFLCQPNNPTGRLVAPGLLEKILEKCRTSGVRLFLDECFVPFVRGASGISMIPRLDSCPHLFILGSFTKLYGMAGLRLGYGLCSDTALLEQMALCGQPWGISTIAQAAGVVALAQDGYVQKSLELLETEKTWLCNRLRELGVDIIGEAANYVFFHATDRALDKDLAQKGILIRSCANFRGLCPGYFRVAVCDRSQNVQLIQAMRQALNAEGQ